MFVVLIVIGIETHIEDRLPSLILLFPFALKQALKFKLALNVFIRFLTFYWLIKQFLVLMPLVFKSQIQ